MNQLTAEILCIGTELLMGDIVNTNAAEIARELAAAGINLYHQTVVGDNARRLREALELAFSRVDIVITTGGLGPTYDDISKEIAAEYFGLPLELNEECLRQVEAALRHHPHSISSSNRKQAMIPKGAVVLVNPNGTAPGCILQSEGKTAVLMPGPPREMGPMLREQVIPFLRKGSPFRLVSRNLHFFGIGESDLEQMLHETMVDGNNPTVAPYAKTGEVLLRVTARVGQEEDPEALLGPTVEGICRVAGEYLYGIDTSDLQTALVKELTNQKLTIATAESCTGGYLTKRITDVPGSSAVLPGGFVTYNNTTKERLLGVSPETLAQYGAISPQTAQEMAVGARRATGADLAIAITGNAGPQSTEGKDVGELYLAVDSAWHHETLPLRLRGQDQDAREVIRYLAASHGLYLALQTVRKKPAVTE